MDRKKIIPFLVVGAVLAAAVVGVFVYRSVQADAPAVGNFFSNFIGMNFGKGAGGGASDQDLATALGITTAQLQTAYSNATDAAVKQAVTSGLITQAQADQIKAAGNRISDLGRYTDLSKIDYNSLLATALGITVDKLQAAYQTAYGAAIDRQVTSGRLTQAQADTLKGRFALANSSKFQSAMQSAFQTAVQQAVTDGLITQAQADQILKDTTSLNQGFGMLRGFNGLRGGPGFGGPGMRGPGGMHGRGFGGVPGNKTAPANPSTAPTATPSGA